MKQGRRGLVFGDIVSLGANGWPACLMQFSVRMLRTFAFVFQTGASSWRARKLLNSRKFCEKNEDFRFVADMWAEVDRDQKGEGHDHFFLGDLSP